MVVVTARSSLLCSYLSRCRCPLSILGVSTPQQWLFPFAIVRNKNNKTCSNSTRSPSSSRERPYSSSSSTVVHRRRSGRGSIKRSSLVSAVALWYWCWTSCAIRPVQCWASSPLSVSFWSRTALVRLQHSRIARLRGGGSSAGANCLPSLTTTRLASTTTNPTTTTTNLSPPSIMSSARICLRSIRFSGHKRSSRKVRSIPSCHVEWVWL